MAIAEFEAAYATAVPEAESKTSGGSPGQNARPAAQPSRPNQPSAQPSRPNQSSAQPSRPNQPSSPAGVSPGGFPSQSRPSGGSGSGNYSPQSGYKY